MRLSRIFMALAASVLSAVMMAAEPAKPLLVVSIDFDGMKQLNGGETVMLPGVAAETKFIALTWDEAAITAAMARGGKSGSAAGFIETAKRRSSSGPGFAFSVSDVGKLLQILKSDSIPLPVLNSCVNSSNLTDVAVRVYPDAKFAANSNCWIKARFRYRQPDQVEADRKLLDEMQKGLKPLLNWEASVDGNALMVKASFKKKDQNEILKRIVLKEMERMKSAEEDDDDDDDCGKTSKARSLVADSDEKVFEVPLARQQEIRDVERFFLLVELYGPVAKALKGEPPEIQKKWQGVLKTAEITMGYYGGCGFNIYREFSGRGAEEAFKQGCHYPVPISYSFSSLRKDKNFIRQAFDSTFANMSQDKRWNAASRMAFFGSMALEGNSSPSLAGARRQAMEEAMYEFLKKKGYSRDELGMVYYLTRFCAKEGEMSKVLARLRSEGMRLDPWLETMLEAAIAYKKAWNARGDGYANTVTEEGWKVYGEEIRKVCPLLEKAYHLRPELSHSCQLALQTTLGDDYASELWLRRLNACATNDVRGLGFYLFGLRPRWGGSTRQMADFLLGLARRRQFNSMVPIFAYERMVKDVFASEGGVRVEGRIHSSIDRFVLAHRKDFEPYFKGYRESKVDARLLFIEKVHLYIALADLAWRLEDGNELLYWWDKFAAIGIPPVETEFRQGHRQYGDYINAIRKLDGERRRDFIRGLHALYIDGDEEVVNRMVAIAEEIGENKLALEAMLGRQGRVDLRPFFIPNPRFNTKQLFLDFQGRQRDHMVYRFKLRGGDRLEYTRFHVQLLTMANRPGRPAVRKDSDFRIEVARGTDADAANPSWPKDKASCSFELEIVGMKARLTQDGRRIWEKQLDRPPSLSKIFMITGFSGIENAVEKAELEVRDDGFFVIQSEKGK